MSASWICSDAESGATESLVKSLRAKLARAISESEAAERQYREDARLIQQQCCDELRDQRRAEHHLQVQNEKLAGDLVTAQSQMNRTEAGALRMKSVVARLSDDVLAEQAECQKLRQNISLLDVELRKHHAEVVEARNVQKAVETELHQCKASGLELCHRFEIESQLRLQAQEENLKLVHP
mmetsp:Transcript_52614/g.139737  ORF Transcript_52614/g.139737 Transcript_52614/m.139737 type:complete len:181 (-) Transcript_52614:755-1297(-)